MKGILLDDTGELVIRNGSVAIGNTDEQSAKLLLAGAPGEWKEYPTTGIGIMRMQHGAIDRFLDRDIRVQLNSIGINVKTLSITEKGIEIAIEAIP
ncbi:MAG: hypothetical protein LBD91_03135 [Prevotellaceae bacterium]|jgi:hypothetical protein|nr:hypothetical protein [Prevotellaceae bacterium]